MGRHVDSLKMTDYFIIWVRIRLSRQLRSYRHIRGSIVLQLLLRLLMRILRILRRVWLLLMWRLWRKLVP